MCVVRRTSLVVVLLLLASVGMASAECAWVLWLQNIGQTPVMANAVGGHDNREQCEAAKARYPEQMKREGSVTVMFVCLPDTIDPRGPKGK
jgi:hypothetical protein